MVAELIRELERETGKRGHIGYVIVNEAGASVYSASDAARQEFPTLDVTQRGTISIARRLQDPLAELVKIDPKAVGVGRYYLFPLAAAGQAGVERALGLMQAEIVRGMKLMGCSSIGQLSRDNLRFR